MADATVFDRLLDDEGDRPEGLPSWTSHGPWHILVTEKGMAIALEVNGSTMGFIRYVNGAVTTLVPNPFFSEILSTAESTLAEGVSGWKQLDNDVLDPERPARRTMIAPERALVAPDDHTAPTRNGPSTPFPWNFK